MFEFFSMRNIHKNFEELDKFQDVLNLVELKTLLNTFITDGRYVFIIENIDFEMFEIIKESKHYSSFINQAYNELFSFKNSINFSLMNFECLTGVYSILVYSCICAYGRMLNYDELKLIALSDFPIKLSCVMDNFHIQHNMFSLENDFF